jgi:hypothetical protein
MDGIVEHFVLQEAAFLIFPVRPLLIPIWIDVFSRTILVIVEDPGLEVSFWDNDSPVGVGGLHGGRLNNHISGGIPEVGEYHAELFSVRIHSQCVIGIGIARAIAPA